MQYNAEVLPFVREILQQKVLIINISLATASTHVG